MRILLKPHLGGLHTKKGLTKYYFSKCDVVNKELYNIPYIFMVTSVVVVPKRRIS